MIYLNGQELIFGKFPNGEVYLEKNKIGYNYAWVVLKFEDNSDLINLMILKGELDERKVKSQLLISYMPYSRMDRRSQDYAFTLKYISDFINYINFERVDILEPHSDVTTALVNNVKEDSLSIDLALELINNTSDERLFIMYPDAGAEKRYTGVLSGVKTLIGYKHRNFKTGNIEKFDVITEHDLTDAVVIIIDDLCSRGGTFLASAAKLRELGAAEVHLCITHLENTSEHGELFSGDLIDSVTATNSIYTGNEYEKLTIVEVIE